MPPHTPLKPVGQGMHGTFASWAKQHLRLRTIQSAHDAPGFLRRTIVLEVRRFAVGTAGTVSGDVWDVISEAGL